MLATTTTSFVSTLIYMIQKKIDKNMERVQATHNNHLGLKVWAALLSLLINVYIKGSGTGHHTQLHKTFTKKTSRKRKTAKES